MYKITFVSTGIINDMYDRLYEWYNGSRGKNGLPKYDVKHVAVTTIAANPKTSLITYEEQTDANTHVTTVIPIEDDSTENVKKQYKNCIHVFYEINE